MAKLDQITLTNFINGALVPPTSGKYLASYEPATGQVYAQIPDSTEQDIDQAVESARLAFPQWSKTTRKDRARILNKIADILELKLEEFAQAESRDQGKPISLARSLDIPRACDNFRYFAGRIGYMEGHTSTNDGVAMSYTQQMPVGVAGLISPWNLPLYLLTWKIAPCIAYGNTCVCKPSEFTSMTAWMLCKVMNEAGLPAGVVNMVFGNGINAGSPLVKHPNVPLISFTGGTVTGERIILDSAKYFKKLSLELGGKNANIIFDDADLEKCIETSMRSSFLNQGEVCLCGSRIFVQDAVYDKFMTMFVDKVKQLNPGDPKDPNTRLGALISAQHLDKVLGYIDIAQQEGGEVLVGGVRRRDVKPSADEAVSGRNLSEGYFMSPTVICTRKNKLNPNKCRITQEEIFGPVVTVTPFSSEQQVIDWANGTQYGLSASVWTENGKRQRRIAEQLRVGTCWVNCWLVRDLNMPFGGVGASGVGREGGDYSREFFTEYKTICLADN